MLEISKKGHVDYETVLESKTHHLIVNKLDGEQLHLDDELIQIIRPEPILVQLINNEPFPREPNK